MSSPGQIDDEREFEAAFRPQRFGAGDQPMRLLNLVRSNNPNLRSLNFGSLVHSFREPDQLRLIGRYVAKNTHLREIVFGGMTDQLMHHLFTELHQCPNLEKMIVRHNHFGREGIESMLPLLNNSCKLTGVNFSHNARMDDEWFGLIVGALNGGGIESLVVTMVGDLTDITALQNCTLPNLKLLNLNSNRISAGLLALEHFDTLEELCLSANDIGLEQCIDLVGLLRNPNASLKTLGLKSDKLCDESIEALAGALKHNSTLEELHIDDWNLRIRERGYLALLRLLLDVSSIANTYSSNHTLGTVKLPPHNEPDPETNELRNMLKETLAINKLYRAMPAKAGKIKVLRNQLNSSGRKEMCDAQGIEFASTGSILANIDPCFLPNVLALVGRSPRDGRDELFDALVETAPDLMALIDRKALLENGLPTTNGGEGPGAKRMRRAE